jgi:hypothetical protein
MINEDYEKDYLKDIMYLQEKTVAMENAAQELLEDMYRFNAKIKIIKQEETEQHDGEIRSELLPF